jgi:peptidoglycan/LPS O-acetylase OafA/YrhL
MIDTPSNIPRSFDPRHNNFDLLRLFAASQVAFIHAGDELHIEFSGWLLGFRQFLDYFPGVPIFFVISGFLISASLDRNPNLKNYAINRCLRIYPALWTSTLLTLFLLVIFGHRIWDAIQASGANPFVIVAEWLIAQFSIAQFYNPAVFRDNFGIGLLNGSLWTIPVELQFYLALPVLAPLLWRGMNPLKQNIRLLGMTLLLFAFSWAFIHYRDELSAVNNKVAVLIRLSLLPYLFIFMLGIILQRNQASLFRLLDGKGFYWLIFYLSIAYIISRYDQKPQNIYTSNLVLMTLLSITVVSLAFTARTLSERALKGNDISYGTYIYHGIVLNLAFEFGFTRTIGVFAVVLLISYLLAMLSWLSIEQPALSLKRSPLLSRKHPRSLT